jgi:hypothetical protein
VKVGGEELLWRVGPELRPVVAPRARLGPPVRCAERHSAHCGPMLLIVFSQCGSAHCCCNVGQHRHRRKQYDVFCNTDWQTAKGSERRRSHYYYGQRCVCSVAFAVRSSPAGDAATKSSSSTYGKAKRCNAVAMRCCTLTLRSILQSGVTVRRVRVGGRALDVLAVGCCARCLHLRHARLVLLVRVGELVPARPQQISEPRAHSFRERGVRACGVGGWWRRGYSAYSSA